MKERKKRNKEKKERKRSNVMFQLSIAAFKNSPLVKDQFLPTHSENSYQKNVTVTVTRHPI
jgi:hypothetical protein